MKTIVRAAILMLLLSPAVPRAAEACGMKESMPSEPRALLVQAYDDAAAGRDARAIRRASALANHRESATPNEKAQAWSIVGAMRFKAGDKTSGLAAFAEAKKLDAAAVETVLAKLAQPAAKKSAPVKSSVKAAAPKASETLVAEIRAALQDA